MILVEFLRARLAEDQQTALGATARAGEQWGASSGMLYNESDPSNHPGPWGTGVWGELEDDVAEHLARHDPARVLAEVEAKRRIVEDCEYYEAEDHAPTDGLSLRVLQLLAAVHADHPDYDPEWRP